VDDTAPLPSRRPDASETSIRELDDRLHSVTRRLTHLEREVADLSGEIVRHSYPSAPRQRPSRFLNWTFEDVQSYFADRRVRHLE
jgi:hypothetical protein